MALHESSRARRATHGLTSPPLELRGVTVLVVDDEPETLGIVETVLDCAHARVVTARSVEAALTLLRTERPDIIVSDIDMPGCDGYQLMRMVRSRTAEEGGRTPAIALTGHTRALDQTRAFLAGYQFHLGKPIDAVTLLRAISEITTTSRA
ncbi:hypothetical protein BH11MYX3_BH11MYX3_38850 [soil metagenome]